MTTIGCGRLITTDEPRAHRQPIVADESLTHAFDTRLDVRLADRLELDSFLRDRDIPVLEGVDLSRWPSDQRMVACLRTLVPNRGTEQQLLPVAI